MVMTMKYSAVSASLIMVRRQAQKTASKLDYELLFLKRADSTYAGGSYAFPGGRVEKQDFKETWSERLTDQANIFDRYHDFNKRMAAIRETFEETNLLLATSQHPKSPNWYKSNLYVFES